MEPFGPREWLAPLGILLGQVWPIMVGLWGLNGKFVRKMTCELTGSWWANQLRKAHNTPHVESSIVQSINVKRSIGATLSDATKFFLYLGKVKGLFTIPRCGLPRRGETKK